MDLVSLPCEVSRDESTMFCILNSKGIAVETILMQVCFV